MDDRLGKKIIRKLEKIEKRIRKLEDYLLKPPDPIDETETYDVSDIPDELYETALKVIVEYERASASLLQRRLAIGYGLASRIIDRLEKDGYVSKADGAPPRTVLVGKN